LSEPNNLNLAVCMRWGSGNDQFVSSWC